jgi:glycosyltransferase involved in cell wall biosynthesis
MCQEFSVIVPHFNAQSNQFSRAIDSVISQANDGLGIELITVDDGSYPQAASQAAKILSAVQKLPNLHLRPVTHPINLGLAVARNSGIAAATGKYVVFLDSDDWLLPDSLGELKTHLDAHPAEITYTFTTLATDPAVSPPFRAAQSDLVISSAFKLLKTWSAGPQELPQLALAMSSWSQVYDRNFLNRSRLLFDPALRRWEDRPFVVSSHLAASSVTLYPRLMRAYFIGTRDKSLTSITRKKFDKTDIAMMYRHLRLVHKSLSLAPDMAKSAYAAQHFWLSVQRYYSVVGGAALPVLFSNSKARRLCLGAGRWLWQQRPISNAGNQKLVAPLPGTLLAKIPVPLRSMLIAPLKYANTPPGASALFVSFALSALFRRLRNLFR